MSKVMHSGVRGANRGCQLFKMIVDGLRMEMASKFVGEHKSGLPLFFIFPSLPFRTAFQAVLHLVPCPLFQQIQHIGGWRYDTDLVVFQWGKHEATICDRPLLKLFVNHQTALGEIYTIPSQSQCLSKPQSGKNHDFEQRAETVVPCATNHLLYLLIGQRLNDLLFHSGENHRLGGIAPDIF